MTRSRRFGSRGRRAALGAAIAATATMAFGVGSASADSLTVPFDDAALTLPIVGTSDILDPPATANISGTVADPAGAITAGDLTFPTFTGTASGVPVSVAFDNTAPITGNLNLTTGVMTTNSTAYRADVQLNPPSGDHCIYNVSLPFTTTGGNPIAGVAFTVANVGAAVSTTHGILQSSWPAGTFTADPNPNCGLINSITAGAGQLALGNGFDLTPATATPPAGGGGTVAPAPKKKCKKAKKHSASASKKSKCKKKKK